MLCVVWIFHKIRLCFKMYALVAYRSYPRRVIPRKELRKFCYLFLYVRARTGNTNFPHFSFIHSKVVFLFFAFFADVWLDIHLWNRDTVL